MVTAGVISTVMAMLSVLSAVAVAVLMAALALKDLSLYFCSILHPQGEHVAVDAEFHGISQGCQLHKMKLCTRNDTHVQEMLPQSALTAYGLYFGSVADLKFT